MNILITGVAGFIGSHLAERLLAVGHKVIGLDNYDVFYSKEVKQNNLSNLLLDKNFSFVELDITDKENLLNHSIFLDIEMVVHLAAKPGVIPSLNNVTGFIDTNITGTNNILELMNKIRCKKMVFASSSSIYGNNKTIPFNENDNVDYPVSPYAFTKKACELLTYNYHILHEFQIINFRFFTVYGPRQRPDLAIHRFFNLIANGETLKIYGDGSSARDYTYIDDTINGICSGIDYVLNAVDPLYEVINLGNNQPVKLSDLIRSIEEVLGHSVETEQKPCRSGDVDITYADIEKASTMLNYKPQHSIKEGLMKFKEWHENK
ncbi:MAG: GDP-mannose 4,6-dehydratase [Flavobacteriales bacterium]|nr:GDP-mannose 4,6-dehydratase [Flavobacteriales bacterium]